MVIMMAIRHTTPFSTKRSFPLSFLQFGLIDFVEIPPIKTSFLQVALSVPILIIHIEFIRAEFILNDVSGPFPFFIVDGEPVFIKRILFDVSSRT